MSYLIIGSAAMEIHGIPGARTPKDVDVLGDPEEDYFLNQDLRWRWKELRKEFYWHPLMEEHFGDCYGIASLDELLTIKLSHAYWDLRNGSWEKHMHDVTVLQDAGAKVIEPIYATLYKVWEEKHGKKQVNLQKEAEEFFTDGVKYIYDHDSVHHSVAYGDRPLFESYRKDGKSVDMDMKKVWAAPFEDQVRLFREEIYAIALERILIPQDCRPSPRGAYAWALKRTITSLTKGKSARFIAENYRIFRQPDTDFLARHQSRRHLLIPINQEAVA